MKHRSTEYLQSLTANNRTVMENVENGMKAWLTRQKKMVEKAIQKGVDVARIISEYKQAVELYDNDYSIPGILSKELGYIKPKGLYQFGDRNWIDGEVKRNYLRPDGKHIDELAEELSNHYNREITPSDIAEFIKDYPDRAYESYLKMNEAKEIFRECVGFNLDSRFIQRYYVSQEQTSVNCPF